MSDYGRAKIAEAKKNGQWETPKAPAVGEKQINALDGWQDWLNKNLKPM